MKKSLLEQKIVWFLINIESSMTYDDLELIKLSQFDDEGKLKVIDASLEREKYLKYWRKFDDTKSQD